jgi:hypothetical protein
MMGLLESLVVLIDDMTINPTWRDHGGWSS